MEVFFEFILHIINKIRRIFKIFLEKGLEFWLYDESDVLVETFILSLFDINIAIEKYDNK